MLAALVLEIFEAGDKKSEEIDFGDLVDPEAGEKGGHSQPKAG